MSTQNKGIVPVKPTETSIIVASEMEKAMESAGLLTMSPGQAASLIKLGSAELLEDTIRMNRGSLAITTQHMIALLSRATSLADGNDDPEIALGYMNAAIAVGKVLLDAQKSTEALAENLGLSKGGGKSGGINIQLNNGSSGLPNGGSVKINLGKPKDSNKGDIDV